MTSMKLLPLLKGIATMLFVLFLTSCSYQTVPTASVNFVSGSNGTITMRAIGFGINTEEAINDAEKNAMNVLLFRGLPESEQKVALVGTNETEEIAKHQDYFTKFFEDMRYKTFVMSSINTTELIVKKDSKKSIAVDIKINYLALRKDLEQNNIIRKFGF